MDKEFFNQKLTWLRLWLTFALTVESACIAWFVSNCNKTVKFFLYADLLAVCGLFILAVIINHKIRKNIKVMRNFINE